MARDRFSIKQGATAPALLRTLRDEMGEPLPLAGATVTFSMGQAGESNVIDRLPCTIVDPALGIVRFDAWDESHTATPGRYDGEFWITYGDGTSEGVPNPDYLDVIIPARVPVTP